MTNPDLVSRDKCYSRDYARMRLPAFVAVHSCLNIACANEKNTDT